MIVKLLTEHHLEFLSLKGVCTGSYESTVVKIPHCWKSHVAAHVYNHFQGKGLTHTEKSDKTIAVFTWTGNKNYGSVKIV